MSTVPLLVAAIVVVVFGVAMGIASRRAAAQLREARDLAERAARTRTTFLANMSHEIRTPMNAVLGFVELVLETDLATEQRRTLELVRSSSETLVMILNDILDYSKLEAEHLELESIPFDLSKVVYGTATLLAVRAREKHLQLLTDVLPDVPRMVRGDPTRLRQVLTNLIGNAIKFTEQGKVGVSVTAAGMEGERARVRFSVSDTGIGIAPEHLGAIFGGFMQVDPSLTRRHGGTGLGLAISDKLVRLMGGELHVTSDDGLRGGSTFDFTLPLPLEAAADRLTGQATLGGRRALVLDHNDTNRRLLRDMLGAEGVAVDEATTAAGVVETLQGAIERGVPYDLMILDAQMPDRDAFDLAGAVRADQALGALRLVMLTDTGHPGDAARCRALGIGAYLTKPISRMELTEVLHAVFAEPEAQGAVDLITRFTIAETRPSLHVLLAEDTVTNQRVAVAMLVHRGHMVDIVGNGREAVEAVKRRDYDVVLMDIQMPVMDGFEATQAIRALPKGKDLPIIALTAHALSGERDRCLAQGMTGYLTKPVNGFDLFSLIEGRLGPMAAAAPPADLAAMRAALREVGAEEALPGIVDAFLVEAPERLAALRAGVAGGTPDAVVQAAHALLGLAVTLRAQDLMGLLEPIEAAARRGDVGPARDGLERVRAAAAAVLAYVEQERGRSRAGAAL